LKLLVPLVAVLLIAAGMLGPGREATAYGVWWLTASQPPEVALAGPPGAVRGMVEVPVETRPSGRVEVVGAEVDGREVGPGAVLRVDTSGLPDGEHALTVRVQDQSLRKNAATATAKLRSDNTPPALDVQPSPSSVPQGHTVVIHIRPNEPAEVQATLGGEPLKLFPAGAGFWAVVGVNPDEQPGGRELLVQGRDRVGNQTQAAGSVSVAPFEFTRDTLQVSREMLPLLAPNIRSAEDEHLKAVYARENGPPRWKGAFTLPVKGPISTEFGEVRSYNGGPFQGYHGGTDFQAGMGTPVLAPARGRVALREDVRLRGKVLVLDHGGGVYTTYAHLQDWSIGENQEVDQGQPIATVGSTGLSTGPHLHWELWVGGRTVNPMEWTEREVP
jgi:murein DD-endopeptidase MepM/ murein hydrolase activator NlpD